MIFPTALKEIIKQNHSKSIKDLAIDSSSYCVGKCVVFTYALSYALECRTAIFGHVNPTLK
jgi:hypothetical protein